MAKKTAKKEKGINYPGIIDRRLAQLRFTIEEEKLDAIAVTYMPNIRYLTNFSGPAGVLYVTDKDMVLVTDPRYKALAEKDLYDLPDFYTEFTDEYWEVVKKHKVLKAVVSLGFEADKMPYAEAVNIRNLIRPVKFKPGTRLVEPFTQPKAEEELEYIKKAARICLDVYEEIKKIIKTGMTEIELANELAYMARKAGSEGMPKDVIVLSGENTAFSHATPTDKKIKKNELIQIDFGCRVNGFCSSISRVFAYGKPTKAHKDAYAHAHEAMATTVKAITPGMNGQNLDEIGRKIIKKYGYGKEFNHELGHGIGIEPLEMPVISPKIDDHFIHENTVLTIKPGVYTDKFGIRLEDNVIVARGGGEYLTQAPEELEVVS
ncbi:MAG: M24 family metallopeptidase [Candidatus Kapaibacterium sp.]